MASKLLESGIKTKAYHAGLLVQSCVQNVYAVATSTQI